MDSIAIHVDDDRVTVQGELDLGSAPELTAAMRAITGPKVLLDLEGVDFIDSSGVRALVDEALRRRADGGDVVIERQSSSVDYVLRLTGLTDLFGL